MSNPALSSLTYLVGVWRVELTGAEWLTEGDSLVGETRVEWLDDHFLVLRSHFGEGPPTSTSCGSSTVRTPGSTSTSRGG